MAERAVLENQLQKAERLLRDKHSCLGCHQLKGVGGVLGPKLDDVRKRIGDNARRIVAERFDVSLQAAKVSALLDVAGA